MYGNGYLRVGFLLNIYTLFIILLVKNLDIHKLFTIIYYSIKNKKYVYIILY